MHGGGGQPDPLPETKGKAPKVAPKQFMKPTNTTVTNPKLTFEPTVVGVVDLPNVNMPNYGNPLSGVIGPASLGGGIGTGLGSGNGAGVGPGSGGGFGGGVYSIGGGVTAPTVVQQVEPEYSEEARKAKYQGEVWLSVVVDENGVPQDIKVTRKLGLGLDEKAIEAVKKWKFKAGTKDGKSVAVRATIAVSFHIL
jgi:TonB family protein